MGSYRAKRSTSQTWQVNEDVWALDTELNKWRRAVIIAGERPGFLSELSSSANDECYVHWKGQDRRLDSWVPYSNLRRSETELSGSANVEWSEAESDDAHAGVDPEYLKEHQQHTKFKTINSIQMGKHIVTCWYFSPYPLEVQNTPRLYICDFCLSFFRHEIEFDRHEARCTARHPPGHEIYREKDGTVAMWEVDGSICRVYCENLCYLSKLFLDHKTLKHPVNLFLFYVLTELQDDGYHIVGYFSKEKYSRNNVSCILILPQHQKKGYGKYLINFSYALALKEGRRGTPERPLSDLGRVSYVNYWRQVLLERLKDSDHFVLDELADELALEPSDILTSFTEAKMLLVEPVSRSKFICLTTDFAQLLSATLGKPTKPIDPHRLRWVPYDPFLAPFEYAAD